MGIPEIVGKFIDIWANKQELYIKVGKATEIDKSNFTFTFTPIDETATVDSVRMKTITDGGNESFTIVPKEGSFVAVDFDSYTTAQCISVQQSEEVLINSDLVIFNQGGNEGMIKIVQLTEKLNALVDDFNALVNKFNTHTHTGVTTGGGSSGPTPTTQQTTATFNKSDYENEKIKH